MLKHTLHKWLPTCSCPCPKRRSGHQTAFTNTSCVIFAYSLFFFFFLQVVIDFCVVQNPCKNGGECESSLDGYVCRCKVGFTGKTCETSKLLQYHDVINLL